MAPVASCLIAVTLAAIVEKQEPGKPAEKTNLGTAYIFRGTNTKILPANKKNLIDRPNARTEIVGNGILYVTETPYEVATAPCIEEPQKK